MGNLVCPAEFDTGAIMNMTILSVPYDNEAAAEIARQDVNLPHRESFITEVRRKYLADRKQKNK